MSKVAFFTALFLLFARPSEAFDPLSTKTNVKGPDGCLGDVSLEKELDLAEIVRLGVCRNPSLRRNFMEIRASEADVGAARSQYLPTVTATAQFEKYYQKYEGRKSENLWQYVGNLGVSWLLFDFGGRSASASAMKAYLDAAVQNYNADMHETVSVLKQAYFELLDASEALKTAELISASYKYSHDETEMKYKRGLLAKTDYLLSKTAYDQSFLQIIAAKAAIKKYSGKLAVLLHLPPQTVIRLRPVEKTADNLALRTNASVDELIKTAVDTRPEVKTALARKQAAENERTAAVSAAAPTLSFKAGVTGTEYAERKVRRSTPYSFENYGMLELNAPLFTGFRNTYNIRKANAGIAQAAEELKNTVDVVKNEVWAAYQDYRAAADSFAVNASVLDTAKENEKLVMLSYTKGNDTLLNVLTVQEKLASARQNYTSSFYEVLVAKAKLYRAVGGI